MQGASHRPLGAWRAEQDSHWTGADLLREMPQGPLLIPHVSEACKEGLAGCQGVTGLMGWIPRKANFSPITLKLRGGLRHLFVVLQETRL